ncbi:peptidase M19 [Streptomyces rimosus subsp. pseudoverticillatus]|nr:peptidase M19 [Streptomyces rimosus subsp. pseudoverticillatus]
MIVNALGQLDNPNTPASRAAAAQLNPSSSQLTVDARAIADAHASGLTAVNITLGYTVGGLPPYEHTMEDIAAWDRLIDNYPGDLLKVRTAADIRRAHDEGRIGVIYGFQNAVAIGEDPGLLDSRAAAFATAGVRVIQLTYNQANHLGDGSMSPANRGLTPFGRQVVDALNDHHVMVDLSHSGENTCLQAACHSRVPVSINHTGCRAVADLPRNKTDAELRLVASQGGFVGIYFMPFLNLSGHATAADVVDHIVHAVNVCGEDHVGIGTDGSITAVDDLDAYHTALAGHITARQLAGVGAAGERADTYPFIVDLRGVDQFRDLIHLLEKHGYRSGRIEKIMGRNFLDYADRAWTT